MQLHTQEAAAMLIKTNLLFKDMAAAGSLSPVLFTRPYLSRDAPSAHDSHASVSAHTLRRTGSFFGSKLISGSEAPGVATSDALADPPPASEPLQRFSDVPTAAPPATRQHRVASPRTVILNSARESSVGSGVAAAVGAVAAVAAVSGADAFAAATAADSAAGDAAATIAAALHHLPLHQSIPCSTAADQVTPTSSHPPRPRHPLHIDELFRPAKSFPHRSSPRALIGPP